MKIFEDRQKGFEAAFQRDQELMFRIGARRNRLFGLWAATRLGLTAGEAAEAYAKTVVAADFEEPGDALAKKALIGALSLYLDFINLFVLLLQLTGQRRE